MADAFIVDVRGDPENAELQQSDRASTPAYTVHARYRGGARADRGGRVGARDDAAPLRRYFTALPKSVGKRRRRPVDAGRDDFIPVAGADHDDDDGVDDEERDWMEKSRELNATLRREPDNIGAWWELVKLQDAVTGCTRAARVEKKTSILTEAVRANPASDVLWLALIRSSAQHLPGGDVDRVWQEALQAAPSALLQEQHVRSMIGSFSTFTMNGLREYLAGLLERLADHAPMLHLLSLWTWVERGAGYTERSTAFCQAAIEFSLFCPAPLRSAPLRDRTDAFERFWESEVPRVGEPNAPTWSRWFESQADNADSVADDGARLPSASSTLAEWFEVESRLGTERWLPVRHADTDDESMLDRIVVFDDLRFVLFDCPPVECAVHLVDELLLAVGIDERLLTRSRIVPRSDDFRLCDFRQLFDTERPVFDRSTGSTAPEGFRNDPVPSSSRSARCAFALSAIDAVLSVGLPGDISDALRITRLAIECAERGVKAAARSAKQLLKANRDSVELCKALADLQGLANPSGADAVYSAVLLQMSDSPWTFSTYSLAWAAAEHQIARSGDPRHLLCCIADGRYAPPPSSGDVTSVQLARARKEFTKLMGRLGDDSGWWHRPVASIYPCSPGLSVSLGAMHLEAICANSVDDMVAWITGVLEPILPPPGGPQREYAWACIVRLLTSIKAPPRTLRPVLDRALAACPLSQTLWQALASCVPQTNVMRGVFDTHIARMAGDGLYDGPVRVLLYAIAFEIARPSAGAAARVHRLLEQGLSGPGRGIVLLWRICTSAIPVPVGLHALTRYLFLADIAFELVRGDVLSAKKVLYRAFAHCPWSRTIWIDTIPPMLAAPGSSQHLSSIALLELVTLMGEKGVRLHSAPPIS